MLLFMILMIALGRMFYFCMYIISVSLGGMNGFCFWNMQVQNSHSVKYNGTIQGLKYIWNTEGFRGMFKGNGTNCARIVPNSAVKFYSYEQASKYVSALKIPPLPNISLISINIHFCILIIILFPLLTCCKQGHFMALPATTWKW